jgi:transposase
MSHMTTIGFDLAKNVFQVHGVDADGQTRVRRKSRRGKVLQFFENLQPCLVGMEACSSSHFWALEIARFGHSVKLSAYVKPYAKRGKTDAADAEANCEAVTRPSMRFVSVKTADQQAVLMLHKTLRVVVADDAAGEPIEAGAAFREALGIGLSLPTLGNL